MHDGVGLPVIFQPAIQRVIMMRRRQVGLVVDRVGIHAVAARRLQHHQCVAQCDACQSQLPVMQIGYARRYAPLCGHFFLHFGR